MAESFALPPQTAHDALTGALLAALRDGKPETFNQLIRTPAGMAALDYSGNGHQTPIYAAVYQMVINDQLTPGTAPAIASRLHAALRTAEGVVGPDTIERAVNMINFSHLLECGRRHHTETLRDLLEENAQVAPHFAGVIQRFHLLSRPEVIREGLIFTGRMDDGEKGPGSPKPF